MPAARAVSALPRHLAIAYGLLTLYACLHPLTGWKSSGLPPLDYLYAPWPKYYRIEDLILNVLGYFPFGFVLAPALPRRIGRVGVVLGTTLIAALLSFGLETLQNYLPNRVSSNVDLGCNTLGALLGALAGMRWGDAWFDERGWLHRWRSQQVIPGHTGDLGLMLLGLWLLAQLLPDTLLYGSGDLRSLLGLATPVHFSPERYIRLETVLFVLTLLSVGLFARCMMRGFSPWPIAMLLGLGVAAKTLVSSTFSVPGAPLLWLTPGTARGLAIGLPLLAAALVLPRLHQHALAGTALLAATTLANLLPENPYALLEQGVARQGSFLNFHGLTQLTAGLWPFLALAYLSAVGLWRGQHLTER